MKTTTKLEAALGPELKRKKSTSNLKLKGRGGEKKPRLGEVCDAYLLTELIMTEVVPLEDCQLIKQADKKA